MNQFDAFAEICKKYGLTKNEGTFRLFCAYESFLFSYQLPRYSPDTSGLGMAKIIKMLTCEGNVTITSSIGDVIELERGSYLRASLAMFTNAALAKMNVREGLLSVPRKLNEEGAICLGHIFNDTDLYELYEQEELEAIIKLDELNRKASSALNAYNGRASARLGYYACLLYAELIDEQALNEIEERLYKLQEKLRNGQLDIVWIELEQILEEKGLIACFRLNKTQKYNLIAELLGAAGIIEHCKGKDEWQKVKYGDPSDIQRKVRHWIESFIKLKLDYGDSALPLVTPLIRYENKLLKERFLELDFDNSL